MYPEWIHCNKCFCAKASTETPFFFSRCQHILCKRCLETTCAVCGIETKVMEIGPSMPGDMKFVFEDFDTSLQKLMKGIKFQWAQRSHLEKSQITMLSKYMEMQKEIKKMKKGLLLLTEDSNKEKYKIEKMQEYFKILKRYENNDTKPSDIDHNSPAVDFKTGKNTTIVDATPYAQKLRLAYTSTGNTSIDTGFSDMTTSSSMRTPLTGLQNIGEHNMSKNTDLSFNFDADKSIGDPSNLSVFKQFP